MSFFNGTSDNDHYAGDDRFVFGHAGSDRLTLLHDKTIASGGSGHDRIVLAAAHLKVAGSSGDDTFVFENLRSNRTIVDFQTGSDKLVFDIDVFGDSRGAFHMNERGFLVFDNDGINFRVADLRGHAFSETDILFA